MFKILKKLLYQVSIFLLYAGGEGSWKLRPYEKKVLDAVINGLPKKIRLLVQTQLKQNFFVERTSPRINIFRYYSDNSDFYDSCDSALKILDPKFDDFLMKVEMLVDGKKQIAHVTFYRGYLFSIEFKKTKKFYIGKEVKIGNVRPGKPSQTYTRAIDRLEHGKDYEEKEGYENRKTKPKK